MNGIVIRLAGVRQPETKLFHQSVITIGTAAECDLHIAPEDERLPAEASLLTISLAAVSSTPGLEADAIGSG